MNKVFASLCALIPESARVSYQQGGGLVREVTFDGFTLRQYRSKKVVVLRADGSESPAKPVLRTMAQRLGVSLLNRAGGPHNTQQLGRSVIDELVERGVQDAGDGK